MRPANARNLNLVQAINEALAIALAADPDVVVMGQDVGRFGGIFRATADLFERFGADRVIDTPTNESGIIGSALGMALYGMRPVAEIAFADQMLAGFDQIVSELSRYRYRTAGQLAAPVTLRMPYGAGVGGGMYHSLSPEAYLVHTPGLVVACPSTPADAKGLLLAAIRSEDPVVFLEPKALYRRAAGPVPEGDVPTPLGRARRVREGDDVTLVAWGAMVPVCEEAARQAAADGIECAIIDPRTLWPLDVDAIAQSVADTGRCVIVHEAPRTGGLGAEIAALVQEQCFLHLEAPVMRVTGFDTPVPHALEHAYLPTPQRVLAAIEAAVGY